MNLPSLAQEQYLIAARQLRKRGIQTGSSNITMLCRVAGKADMAALDTALNGLVGRHAALRCRFRRVNGHHIRESVVPTALSWTTVTPKGDPVTHLRKLAEEPIADLGWPLFRAAVAPGDPTFLMLSIHHLIADAWSVELIRGELWARYEDAVRSRSRAWPPAPSYLAYADAQRARLSEPARMERGLARWRAAIRDRPLFPPLAIRDPEIDRLAIRQRSMDLLDPKALRTFEFRCYQAQATLLIGLAAAFGLSLQRTVGIAEAGMLVALSHRDEPQWDAAVGWFAHVSPCYFTVPGSDDLGEQVASARPSILDMLSRQDLPFPYALKFLDPATYEGSAQAYPTCVLSLTYARGDLPHRDGDWAVVETPSAGSASHRLWLHRTAEGGLRMMATSPAHQAFADVEDQLAAVLSAWSASDPRLDEDR